MLRDLFRRESHRIDSKRVGRLMAKMGIAAIFRKLNTSKRFPKHPVYPYLLRTPAGPSLNQLGRPISPTFR